MTPKDDNQLKKYQKNRIHHLPVSEIQTDPNQPRKHFDEEALDELSKSIEKHGVLQPVLFRTDDDGQVILVSGERRLRACQKAGKVQIPAIFADGSPAEIALIENIMRQDLTPLEEAEAMQNLLTEHEYTQERLAEILGKSQPTISSTLSLVDLPEEVKEACKADRRISKRELVKLAAVKNHKKIMMEFKKVIKRVEAIEKGKRTRSQNKAQTIVTIASIQALTKKLGKVENKWNEKDKKAIKFELIQLKEKIEKIISEED